MKGSNVDFPCGLVRYTSEPGRFMNEDILEYKGTYYTLSETRMPFKSDKTVDEDYFILTLFALALEAKSRSITLSGKDIVLGVGLHQQISDNKHKDSNDILWNTLNMAFLLNSMGKQ